MEQRHKDELRRHKFEQPHQTASTNIEYGNRGEAIIDFGAKGPIYDGFNHGENIPDPRFGQPGFGGTGAETELIFQQPIASIEWSDNYQHLVETEAGPIAQQTWAHICDAIKGGSIDMHGMTWAEIKKALASLLIDVEGMSARTAKKRIAQLQRSASLKRLVYESRRGDRYQPSAPPLVRVGKGQRKKVGCEQFNRPDRRLIGPKTASLVKPIDITEASQTT